MGRKKIGIDLDDVLLDFNGALCSYHNARYEPRYTRDTIRTFALEDTWGCSREEARKRIFDFYVTDEHAGALPMPGSLTALQKISSVHDCLVVTSRPDSIREKTLLWCEKNFPGMFQNIHFTNQFGVEIQNKHKGHICQELGIDIFIEDAPMHAQDVAQAGIPVLLYDVPWNQDMAAHPNISRVFSWEEIVKTLC